MKIKIESEEELVRVAQESLHILANLRKFGRLWDTHHGSYFKDKKKYWEAKADELLDILQVPEHRQATQIKIKIDERKI